MLRLLFISVSLLISITLSAQNKGLDFLGRLAYSEDLSDIWGWEDGNGNEYALVGVYNGFSVVDVTDPTQPNELFFTAGPRSIWRDVKTWNGYAYIIHDSGPDNGVGLQILDLNFLPDSLGSITTDLGIGLSTSHNIFIDENGVGYIVGHNLGNGGAIFIDCDANPTNPPVLGNYNERYVHDLYTRGDTMWSAEIDDGFFSVVDVSDKTNPVVLATKTTPGFFSHNVWLSHDGTNLLTTDEIGSGVIGSYDVSNLNNIQEVDQYISSPGQNVVPHNVFIQGEYGIIAYYNDGIIVLDINNPSNLIEVGKFDTSPFSGFGFDGAWGVYPYLPSGNILATDVKQGLIVLGRSFSPACYLEGLVTELGSGNPINQVNVEIVGSTTTSSTGFDGVYQTGIADSGTYDVLFSKSGFQAFTATNVVLRNGQTTIQNAELVPAITITLNGQILDSSTNQGIANAEVLLINSVNSYSTSTDANGDFTVANFETGQYTLYGGQWGYETRGKEVFILSAADQPQLKLLQGYYDDFFFDFNWLSTGNAASGSWEKDSPVGTTFNSQTSNPGADVPNDIGVEAYITGNGGGGAGADDVDDGVAVLSSPIMDLTTYSDPVVSFSYWFFNDGGQGAAPNDALEIRLVSGGNVISVGTIDQSFPGWQQFNFRVVDFTALSTNMRFQVEIGDDANSGHIVEGGIDLFRVIENSNSILPVVNFVADGFSGCPGTSITFTDSTGNNPTDWFWNFGPGASPQTSAMQNPTIRFDDAGTYTVVLTATNANGSITASRSNLITIYDVPTVSINAQDESLAGQSDGSVSLTVNGGVAPYDYQYTPSLSNSDAVGSLAPGNYEVMITDANGCAFDTTFSIAAGPVGIADIASLGISVSPIPAQEQITLSLSENWVGAELSITDLNGKTILVETITKMNFGLNIAELATGTYLLNVKAESGEQGATRIVKL